MAQWLSVLKAFLAVIPAAAAFFLAYGRYDGTFHDNVVFLYFIGGLAMGGLLGFISLLVLGSFAAGSLLPVLLLALFFPVSTVMGINRRKWQGQRHAVFNGGAFGLGIAVMMSFTFIYRLHATLDVATGVRAFLLAIAFAGLFFAMGLLAGDAVRRRAQIKASFLGTAILLPPAIFLVEYVTDQAWLWVVVLAAYGVVVGVLAERRLLLEGVEDEARKQRRRIRRRDV